MVNRLVQSFGLSYQRPHSPHLNAPNVQEITTAGAAQGQNSQPFSPQFKDWEQGRKYQTRSGIRVRSKIEKIIADFLTASDLTFIYEPQFRIGNLFLRPDFYFPEYGLLYEHFGLNTPEYLRSAEAKIRSYNHAGIPFMYTTFEDETDIEDVIVEKLAITTLEL
ncbi:MAG: hypothetical protein ACLQAH_09005 [Limisphaerales bacterium]